MATDLKNKAEQIKQALLTLQQKGYGKTDVSQIPKGTDISNLPSIPLPDGEPNNLLTFKETLSKVTNLAREKRNALSMEFMAPFSGIAPASDFNSILSNLNKASDTYAKDILKETQPKYELRNHEGDLVEVEFDPSGRAVNSRVVIKGKAKTDDKDIAGLGDFTEMSTKDLKNNVRSSFGEDFKNKLFQELTDEQLREFIIDYKKKQTNEQMSISPGDFLKEWKDKVLKKESEENLTTDEVLELMDKGYSEEEIQDFLDKGLTMEQINALNK